MYSLTRGHPTGKEIYGATTVSQIAGESWQYSKSPVLAAIRPVLLDTFPRDNNNLRQFTANVRANSLPAGEKHHSLNSSSQSAAFSNSYDGKAADSLFDLTTDGRDGLDSESWLPYVYNSNFNENRINPSDSGDIDFAKYDQKKLLELSMIDYVEQSTRATEEGETELALSKAREALKMYNLLENLVEQESRQFKTTQERSSSNYPMTTGIRLFELSLMVNSNLAEQLKNANLLEESMDVYMQLCKLASSSSGGSGFYAASSNQQHDSKFLLYRFGLNIGNILHRMKEYQRALKYYRLTLDRISSTGYKNLKIKLMNNIAITLFVEAEQNGKLATKDCLVSMSVLLADNLTLHASESGSKESKITVCNSNNHKFCLNLMTCQYLVEDGKSMLDTMKSFVRADICHQYRRVFEFSPNSDGNESGLGRVLTNNKGVELKQQSRQRDKIDQYSMSSHASMSTKRLERASRVSGQISDNQTDDWSTGQEQRTTSALGALGSSGNMHDTSKLIGKSRDERPHTTLTTSSNFEQNRANFQRASELRGIPNRLMISGMSGSEIEMMKSLVLSSIERDRLEKMICKQHELTSRALITGCNLVVDLESKSSNQHRSSQSSNRSSAFEICSQLLLSSETFKYLANDLRMSNVVETLLSGDKLHLQSALDTFKNTASLTRESMKDMPTNGQSSMVGTNLSLLNLLQNDYEKATDYAENATRLEENNPDALTNLANCYYFRNDLRSAKTIYRKATAVNPSLAGQASYNLAIVNRKLGLGSYELDEPARSWLKSKSSDFTSKIQTGRRALALPAVQSALLRSHLSEVDASTQSELLSLIARSNQSPELYLIASEEAESDEAAMKILQRANSEHPYHLPSLERLVALNIKAHNYQGAKRLLIDCIKVRPDQSKWYQILAECCRRSAEYDHAMAIFKLAINLFPRDIGCLVALIKITEELGIKNDNYKAKLEKLEAAVR